MPTLVVLNGPSAGMQFPIVGDRFVIGREPTCDALVSDPAGSGKEAKDSVSRQHSLITYAEGYWHIEDGDGAGKKSRNGTILNDRKLPFPGRRRLRDQQRNRAVRA